jgi:hypothetical protein
MKISFIINILIELPRPNEGKYGPSAGGRNYPCETGGGFSLSS